MRTRRDLLLLLGTGLLGPRSVSLAEAARRPRRIGVLGSYRRPDSLTEDKRYGSLVLRLRELGYVEGIDLVFEWRFAAGDYDRLPAMAEELAALPVDLIVTHGTQGIRAAQKATRTIPIVFTGGADLVASGFVRSLSRPGGNSTGISLLLSDTIGKQLELLLRVVPKPLRPAILFNPANDAHEALVAGFREAASGFSVQVIPVGASKPDEVKDALSRAVRERADALIVIVDSFLVAQHPSIVALATKYRFPSMSGSLEFIDAGGLMAYGPSTVGLWRRAGDYVDKILKGTSPGDIPVEQPKKLDLIINRGAAEALGLMLSPELLLLADRVIE